MNLAEPIKKAKKDDAAAQRWLFDKLAPPMFLLCRRYIKNHEDAEERLLTGFLKFFNNLPSFHYNGDASVYGWLKKIMINECLMFLRKKNLFLITSDNVPEELPITDDALANLGATEIFNLIVELPPGYRTVFNLFAIEGMGHPEIARLLNISEGTSKSQLSKAKALLQKMYTQNHQHYATRQIK